MQTNSLIPAVLCPNSTPSETNSTYVLNAAIWFLDVLGIDSSNSYGLQGKKVKSFFFFGGRICRYYGVFATSLTARVRK